MEWEGKGLWSAVVFCPLPTSPVTGSPGSLTHGWPTWEGWAPPGLEGWGCLRGGASGSTRAPQPGRGHCFAMLGVIRGHLCPTVLLSRAVPSGPRGGVHRIGH